MPPLAFSVSRLRRINGTSQLSFAGLTRENGFSQSVLVVVVVLVHFVRFVEVSTVPIEDQIVSEPKRSQYVFSRYRFLFGRHCEIVEIKDEC